MILITAVTDTFVNVLIILCIVLAVLLIAVAAFFLIREWRMRKLVRELTDYVTRVQDLSELPGMNKIAEGEFGILQSEIYKVVTILREEYSEQFRQKRYLSDMMSDLSHQFKTPLTAISLMTELLMAPDVTEEQRLEYAAKIDSQRNRMTWLIRNLLTLSQMEAGVLEMKSEAIRLSDMMEEISDSLSILAEVAEVDLQIHVPEAITVTGDPQWLREAVTNIVKNGIEHTPAGGFVSVTAVSNNLFTRILIEDNGKGISREHLPHIFERFYKAGNESTGSVGIGLAMAKRIINSHGGTIEATSEVGKGTCFEIKLY